MNSCISFRAIVTVVCVLGVATTSGRSQVVINEFAYDDSRDDDEEFVELFNAGDTAVDLTGWFLATGSDLGIGPQYDLPDASVIEAGGFLVIGSAGVPEVDITFPALELFGNGPAYFILWDDAEEVTDAVAYEANKGLAGFPDEATLEGGIWGNHRLERLTHMSLQRWFDGCDTDTNAADFGHLPWTPGESNNRPDAPLFDSDFEDGSPEEPVEVLPGSFVPGRIIDPTSISPSNPNAIPESPDGASTRS